MLFNSVEFLIFISLFIILFKKMDNKKLLVLLASYIFYMYWNPIYIALILYSTVLDFYLAKNINRSNKPFHKRVALILSLIGNLGSLFYFKYFNFFLTNLNTISGNKFELINIILPVGISFYSFQTLSYTIDVYRGSIKPEKSLLNFALYVCYFPQLIAGPIERAQDFLGQVKSMNSLKLNFDLTHINKIMMGFFKKIVVADRLSVIVDFIYTNPNSSSLDIIVAMYLFTFQIYCDFSGYCDIAIGISRIIGINLTENFQRPYFAKSIKEFWGRWHITLSRWFSDYVYIPLGGSRVSSFKVYRNILIVFTLSGLWHGASWNYLIWGALHGIFLMIEKVGWLKFKSDLVANVFTFHFAVITWLFFRIEKFENLKSVIISLGKFDFSKLNIGTSKIELAYSIFFILILIALDYFQEKNIKISSQLDFNINSHLRAATYSVITIVFIFFGVFSKSSFIYFQF